MVPPVNDRPPGPYTRVHPWSELPYDAEVYDNRASVIGIAEGTDRNLYVLTRCNRNSCEGRPEAPILKFDPEGRLLASFGAGLFVFPHNLTIDRDGNVWTTDEGNHAVRKFTADGRLLMTIGQPGKAGGPPMLLTSPTGVLVAPNGNVFVTEGHDNSPKAAVARVIWEQTTVPQSWLAAKLMMGSAANVSQQLRRKDHPESRRSLPRDLRVWMASVNKC